ncbi:MAG: hypothetical protein QM762_17865 [Chryseolinea sp.]
MSEIVLSFKMQEDLELESAIQQEFEFEKIESRGAEGTMEIVLYVISVAGTSPLLFRLIRFIDDRLKEKHQRGIIQNVKITNGTLEINNVTPEDALKIMEQWQKNNESNT